MFPLAASTQISSQGNSGSSSTISNQPPSSANTCNASCNGSVYCMKACSLTIPFVLENITKVQECIKKSCTSMTDFVCSSSCNYKVMGLDDAHIQIATAAAKVGSKCAQEIQSQSPECFQLGVPCSGSNCPKTCSSDSINGQARKCQAKELKVSESDVKSSIDCQDKKCADNEDLKGLLKCGLECTQKLYSNVKADSDSSLPKSGGPDTSNNSTGSSSGKSNSNSNSASNARVASPSLLQVSTIFVTFSLITNLLQL